MKKFKIVTLLLISSMLYMNSYSTPIQKSGLIYNETWTNWTNGPDYEITGNCTVVSGYILTIEPGVTIQINNGGSTVLYQITVEGSLSAIGNSNARILFTPTSTTTGWKGIKFNNVSTSSDLQYCDIEYSKDGAVSINSCGSYVNISYCNISNNNTALNSNGGGIYINSSEPIISYNFIAYNYASNNGGGIFGIDCGTLNSNLAIYGNTFFYNDATNNGGGIYTTNSEAQISDNYIDWNAADYGGGIYIDNSTGFIVNNQSLSNNTAWNNGAGIYVYYSDGEISNNSNFSDNYAYIMGGGIYDEGSDIAIHNLYLDANMGPTGGGGIYLYNVTNTATIENLEIANGYNSAWGSGIFINSGNPVINACNIHNNYGDNGAGIYIDNSDATISSCKIQDNEVEYDGAGIYILGESPTILNNLITGNIAGIYGGGIYLEDANDPIINSNTIADNEANDQYGDGGGGIYSTATIGIYYNDILWGNTDIYGPNSTNAYLTVFNYSRFYYCDVQGYPGGGNAGMMGINPCFNTNVVQGDYRLHLIDPSISNYNRCIDAGYDGATIASYDLNGNARIVDVVPFTTYNIDLGAYEHSGYCPPDPYILIPAELLSVNKNTDQINISCFPNPASSEIFINFNLNQASEIQIDLTGLQGNIIESINKGIYSTGDYTKDYNIDHLTQGMYFIKFTINNDIHFIKFVKN